MLMVPVGGSACARPVRLPAARVRAGAHLLAAGKMRAAAGRRCVCGLARSGCDAQPGRVDR